MRRRGRILLQQYLEKYHNTDLSSMDLSGFDKTDLRGLACELDKVHVRIRRTSAVEHLYICCHLPRRTSPSLHLAGKLVHIPGEYEWSVAISGMEGRVLRPQYCSWWEVLAYMREDEYMLRTAQLKDDVCWGLFTEEESEGACPARTRKHVYLCCYES